MNDNNFGEDNKKTQYLYNELEKINDVLPTEEKLEELQKIEIYLETKYDVFYELGYFF